MDLYEIECQEVFREVELYLDGELAAERSVVIERHLTGCGSCLGHVEFRRELRAIVARKCGAKPVPTELFERIRGVLFRD